MFGLPGDWDVAAVDAAQRICAHNHETHYGAMPWWRPGYCVVFSNRCEADSDEGRLLIDLLRQKLRGREMGFGVDPENTASWAMIVQGDDAKELAGWIVEAARIADGYARGDKNWEAYKRAQGLSEPSDSSGQP